MDNQISSSQQDSPSDHTKTLWSKKQTPCTQLTNQTQNHNQYQKAATNPDLTALRSQLSLSLSNSAKRETKVLPSKEHNELLSSDEEDWQVLDEDESDAISGLQESARCYKPELSFSKYQRQTQNDPILMGLKLVNCPSEENLQAAPSSSLVAGTGRDAALALAKQRRSEIVKSRQVSPEAISSTVKFGSGSMLGETSEFSLRKFKLPILTQESILLPEVLTSREGRTLEQLGINLTAQSAASETPRATPSISSSSQPRSTVNSVESSNKPNGD